MLKDGADVYDLGMDDMDVRKAYHVLDARHTALVAAISAQQKQ